MKDLGQYELEDAAEDLAGNWRKWEAFGWLRMDELDDAHDWGIIYTSNRDSTILEKVNAEEIHEALKPYSDEADELHASCPEGDPDVVFERHNHFLVGYVDGFSIRVYRGTELTQAFRELYRLAKRLDDYPVLDEEAWSAAEYEATLENIDDSLGSASIDLPEGWSSEVYQWLSEHDPGELDDSSGQGGYPSRESIVGALYHLGHYIDDDDDDR